MKFLESVEPQTKTTLIVPIAGEGNRFKEAGYETPKPYIPLTTGMTITAQSLSCIPLSMVRRVFFVRRLSQTYVIAKGVKDLIPPDWHNSMNDGTLEVDVVTEIGAKMGAAMSVYTALDHLRLYHDDVVTVMNCDQFFKDTFVRGGPPSWLGLDNVLKGSRDGDVLVFTPEERHEPRSRWSYPVMNSQGLVEYIIEKPNGVPPSPYPTVGVYTTRSGLLQSAIRVMMDLNRRVNDEFYLAPAFSFLGINRGVTVSHVDSMYGIGTPKDVEVFEDSRA